MEKLKAISEITLLTTELPNENDWFSNPWYQLYRMKWREIPRDNLHCGVGGPSHSGLHKRGGGGGGGQAWL